MAMTAATAFAGGERGRKGLLLGLNAGWGSAGYSSQVGKQTLTDDPFSGGAGGLRFGYAFSNSFALSLEGTASEPTATRKAGVWARVS